MNVSSGPRRSFFNYHDAEWQAGLFRTFAIAVLSVAFATGPAGLIHVLGGPVLGHLLPVGLLTAILGVVVTETLSRPDRRSRRGLAVRLGEFLVVVLVARLAVWVHSGFPSLAEIGRWVIEPGMFFDGEYIAGIVVLASAWLFAVLAARDFFDLRIQADEVAARESRTWGDSASQWRVFQPVSRTEVLGRFASRWLVGGMLLVACAAAGRLVVTEQSRLLKFALRDAGLQPIVLIGLLAYFVTGLILMSHGRLAVLRGRWYNQGVRIAPHLARRWQAITVVTLLAVGLLALLLPLGPTGLLARGIEWVLALLWRFILWLMMLFQTIVALLLFLLQGNGPPVDGAPIGRMPPPQVIPTQAQVQMQLPDWLGGAVLWATVILAGAYLLMRFLGAGGPTGTALGRSWVRLRLWWRARGVRMRQDWRAGVTRVRARWARRLPQRRATGAQGEPMPATPQEEVRAYYLQAVREAEARGVLRLRHETPLEYARNLDQTWPEAKEDVEALTEAFLEARYSRQEIDRSRANSAQALWRRLARAFGRRPGEPDRG